MQYRNAFLAAAAAAAVALLAACAPEQVAGAPAAGDDVPVSGFIWRVRDAETMAAEHRAATGQQVMPEWNLQGYAGTINGVPMVTTLPPRYVDDDVACTLGHEVMHLALGDYHSARGVR